MTTGNGATGVAATNGTVDNVVVFGPGATNVNGLRPRGRQVHDATVNVTGGSGNTAIRSLGGNLLYSDSTWNGGAVGYRLVSGTDTVSRVTVNLAETAISVEGGTLNIDDAVIDLGTTGQTGLQAKPSGAADTATANANHLTVVGGNGTSRGVAADANGAGTPTATISLTNSIVRGPTTSLVRSAVRVTRRTSRSAGPTTSRRRPAPRPTAAATSTSTRPSSTPPAATTTCAPPRPSSTRAPAARPRWTATARAGPSTATRTAPPSRTWAPTSSVT